MNATEKFKSIKVYLEEEIKHWTTVGKQQFGSVDLNTSLSISGIIDGLQIVEDFIKSNEYTDENWNILATKINAEIEKAAEAQKREFDIEAKNYPGGQIQGLRKVKIRMQNI